MNVKQQYKIQGFSIISVSYWNILKDCNLFVITLNNLIGIFNETLIR